MTLIICFLSIKPFQGGIRWHSDATILEWPFWGERCFPVSWHPTPRAYHKRYQSHTTCTGGWMPKSLLPPSWQGTEQPGCVPSGKSSKRQGCFGANVMLFTVALSRVPDALVRMGIWLVTLACPQAAPNTQSESFYNHESHHLSKLITAFPGLKRYLRFRFPI